ncbi:MAG: hypothetical protein ACE5K7_01865, partial [Phycisphaerae bacterium]
MALFPTGGRWRFEIRRLVHVGVLLGVAVAICLPRLLWVHQETGQWVIDTRQITAPLRLWQAIKERTFQYGQLGLWRRGGFKAFAETLEILAAALGPATLLVGLYAIYRRPTTLRWRIQWIPALAVLFSILLMTISHRLTKRYLLEAGALWQVWGGVGLAMVSAWLFQRLHRRRQRDLQRPDPPALVYIVAACATLVQLPWAMVSLKASHRSERVMGQWILQNLGSGQRIIAPDAIPAWYARGRYITWPGVRRARHYGRFMRRYIQKTRADLLLLDERYRNRCPEVFADAAARRWPYRAILHRVGDQQRSLSLVAVGPATGEQR